MVDDPKRKQEDDKPDVGGKDELAENAKKHGKTDGEEAVEDYDDAEDTYSREPDSVDSKTS